MSFNKVILMGNITRDPELKYLQNQTALCSFGLALNRKFKTAGGEMKEEVCFADCTAWGKTAETISQYFQKGAMIHIEGRLRTDEWETKDGVKRSKLSVTVESFSFCGGPKRDESTQQRQQPARQTAGKQASQSYGSDEQQFQEDDIPF